MADLTSWKADSMKIAFFRRSARLLPECLLLAAFSYFAMRKLGTFPAAWADDSLFMLVAKMIAEGRGYVLPILGFDWPHPYILAVGPTLIYPAAIMIRIFGFSVAAARVPMVLYLGAAIIASYLYVQRACDRISARWNAALLISLSAFINTGKPVLGEVPGFFFLMLGLLLMQQGRRNTWSACAAGIALGLAVITKLPYGIIFPALALSWGAALLKREWREILRLSVIIGTAGATLLLGAYWLGGFEPGFLQEIRLFLFERKATAATAGFSPLYSRPWELLRIAYGHFALMIVLAIAGWVRCRKSLRRSDALTVMGIALLFALYFLNGPGWYRALLPATLLLFLFAPAGAFRLLGRWGGSALLLGIVLLQGTWQAREQGSSPSSAAAITAQALQKSWTDTPMVIAQAEVFVRLPMNPRWLYFSDEMRDARRQPPSVDRQIAATRCLPVLRRVNREDFNSPQSGMTQVSGRYFLFDPPADCPH